MFGWLGYAIDGFDDGLGGDFCTGKTLAFSFLLFLDVAAWQSELKEQCALGIVLHDAAHPALVFSTKCKMSHVPNLVVQCTQRHKVSPATSQFPGKVHCTMTEQYHVNAHLVQP